MDGGGRPRTGPGGPGARLVERAAPDLGDRHRPARPGHPRRGGRDCPSCRGQGAPYRSGTSPSVPRSRRDQGLPCLPTPPPSLRRPRRRSLGSAKNTRTWSWEPGRTSELQRARRSGTFAMPRPGYEHPSTSPSTVALGGTATRPGAGCPPWLRRRTRLSSAGTSRRRRSWRPASVAKWPMERP